MTNPVRKWRDKRGKSLRELAQLANVNQATISKIENGHVLAQYRTLRKLADALDAPIEEFESLVDTGNPERGRKGGLASGRGRKDLEDTEQKDDIPESRAA